MGDRAEFDPGVTFQVKPPPKISEKALQIKLLCNGRLVAERSGEALTYQAKTPGVYRVEIYLAKKWSRRSLPWVFSNPITLTESRATQ